MPAHAALGRGLLGQLLEIDSQDKQKVIFNRRQNVEPGEFNQQAEHHC